MHDELKRGFDRVEEQKATLLARVAARDEAEQVRERAGGGWSPRALVHHLVLAEEQVLNQIAASAEGTPGRVRASRRPLVALLAGAMRAGVPLPAPPAMTPPSDASDLLSPGEAVVRWDAVRRTLRERLEAVPPENVGSGAPIALHPIAGPLDAKQVLNLLDAHLVYHLRQAARWGVAARAREKSAG